MLDAPLGHTLGEDDEVPCHGGPRRYVNLDHAASTPVLEEVWEAVQAFAPAYSSVHRGSGHRSQAATEAYEAVREQVAHFLGARAGDSVVLVRNTTEAINVLAAALPPGTRVLSSRAEHHANMLPWRQHELRLLPFTRSAEELVAAADRAMDAERIDLLAVTGASNVTGEVWPVAELAAVAHRHGARLFVDAAQLAPHRPIDMAAAGIDLLAFSGHKLYAPFGAGALVGDLSWLPDRAPLLQGGGAIELVTEDDVIWAPAPDRHEAGSPNVVGAVALGAACEHLSQLGMETVAARERALAEYLWNSLAHIGGVDLLTLWPQGSVDRVGVATFTLAGYRHCLVAAILSAEHAIGVRHGCFCAHLLIVRLLGVTDAEVGRLRGAMRAGRRPPLPGAVRASLGLGSTTEDVDRLAGALESILRRGPARRYGFRPALDEFQPLAVTRPADAAPRRRTSSAA